MRRKSLIPSVIALLLGYVIALPGLAVARPAPAPPTLRVRAALQVRNKTGTSVKDRARRQPQPAARISRADDAFLEDLTHRAFLYFWEQTNPQTGLTLDRAPTNGISHAPPHPSAGIASLGATGFGLTSLCIAADKHWIRPAEARARARHALRFMAEHAPQEHGWFYHWMEQTTGERRWQSELSSIDTALFLGGALTLRQCFADDAEIVRLATLIYSRVDFAWMLNGHPTLLAHGWTPEKGFLAARWDTYSEGLLLYLLALGASPDKTIPEQSWSAWRRDWVDYGGFRYLAGDAPLFIHQYPQAWFDLRHRREQSGGVNYYTNSVRATRAHRRFCIDLAPEFPAYNANIWGLTASDSAQGYVAWGGPPRHPAIDGTVVPCAAAGSLMFTPDISLPALRAMKRQFGPQIYGRYGFTDAFNPRTKWLGPDVIGIDAGITLLSAENLRTGKIWYWFMQNPAMQRALRRAGLHY